MITPPTAAPVIETTPLQEQLPLPVFEDNFDWSNMNVDNDFTTFNVNTTYNIQMITPATSVQNYPAGNFNHSGTACVEEPKSADSTTLSPGGQGNVTLLSPSYSTHDGFCDEGYEEFATKTGKPTHDFALYDSAPENSTGSQQLFQDLSPFMPPAWNGAAPVMEMER